MILFVILLAISIILESSLTTIPLVLILLLNFTVASRKTSVFAIAFVCGILIDIMLGNTIGKTSIFYMITLLIVFLYERKFDTQTFTFVFIASFLSSLFYLVIFEARFVLLTALISAVLGITFFWLMIAADRLHIRDKSIKLEYER